jgi:Secretion system C-terminal sorting domain
MRNIICILSFLSLVHLGCAQYTYWNHTLTYPSDTITGMYGYVEQTQNGYRSFGSFGSTNTGGTSSNLINEEGFALGYNNTKLSISSIPGASGYANLSWIKLDSEHYLNTRTVLLDGQRFFPYYVFLDSNLDTLSTWYYDAYPSIGGYNSAVFGSTAVNQNEFVNVCYSMGKVGLRLIHANTNHEILSDAFWYPNLQQGNYAPSPEFAMQGNGDTLLICGEWGYMSGIDMDFQVYLMKTDFLANDVRILEFGNPDNCYDLAPGIVKMPNGNVLMLYSKCLTQTWINESTVEFHAMEINTNSMSIVNDVVLDLGSIDDGIIGQLDVFRLIKNPFGGYLAYVQAVSSGGVDLVQHLLKLDDNLQVEWLQPYHTDLESDLESIIEVISTSDGGYLATGESLDDLQRQWVFKIDACGYELPSGCPATVGVSEQAKNLAMQVWPNPFSTQLKASLPQSAQSVSISDATGRIVFKENIYFPNQTFNLSWLADGMYLFNVQCSDGRVLGERIVKK